MFLPCRARDLALPGGVALGRAFLLPGRDRLDAGDEVEVTTMRAGELSQAEARLD